MLQCQELPGLRAAPGWGKREQRRRRLPSSPPPPLFLPFLGACCTFSPGGGAPSFCAAAKPSRAPKRGRREHGDRERLCSWGAPLSPRGCSPATSACALAPCVAPWAGRLGGGDPAVAPHFCIPAPGAGLYGAAGAQKTSASGEAAEAEKRRRRRAARAHEGVWTGERPLARLARKITYLSFPASLFLTSLWRGRRRASPLPRCLPELPLIKQEHRRKFGEERGGGRRGAAVGPAALALHASVEGPCLFDAMATVWDSHAVCVLAWQSTQVATVLWFCFWHDGHAFNSTFQSDATL